LKIVMLYNAGNAGNLFFETNNAGNI
jgi:hypothetical protein